MYGVSAGRGRTKRKKEGGEATRAIGLTQDNGLRTMADFPTSTKDVAHEEMTLRAKQCNNFDDAVPQRFSERRAFALALHPAQYSTRLSKGDSIKIKGVQNPKLITVPLPKTDDTDEKNEQIGWTRDGWHLD